MQLDIEIKIYIKEKNIFFDVMKLTTSKENAEKVVNEPSKPITKKNFTTSSGIYFT